jgi:hypothetical protein
MKAAVFTLLMLAITAPLHAKAFFRSVSVRGEQWDVQFHEAGGRYGIQIDGVDRGTSGYLQLLILNRREHLHLRDKHWHYDVRVIADERRRGVEITKTYRDRVTGEQKTETVFESAHDA